MAELLVLIFSVTITKYQLTYRNLSQASREKAEAVAKDIQRRAAKEEEPKEVFLKISF